MKFEDLKMAHRAEPFKPFDVCLSDGRTYTVPHPDFLFFFPGNQRTVIVASRDGTGAFVNVMLITALDFDGPKKKRSRRKKAG